MAFNDLFRLSSHAVISDEQGRVLLLKASYGNKNWGLPGGALDKGETIHQALIRECREELACEVAVKYLSGVYFHQAYNSQAFIFRCGIKEHGLVTLSEEHSEFGYFHPDEMPEVQRRRVDDCLNYTGTVYSAKF